MRSGKLLLLASSALIGPMTAAERRQGRYMRAPDHPTAEQQFAEFASSGDVEVGESNAGVDTPAPTPPKRTPRQPKPAAAAPTPAAAPAIEETKEGEAPSGEETPAQRALREGAADEGGEGDEGEGEGGEEKPRGAKDRIRELNTRLRTAERERQQMAARLEALEKGVLPPANGGATPAGIGEAPNPLDAAKYPLGHLDERYIEDKLDWLATSKAASTADAVLQRQQEAERTRAQQQQQTEILGKVDDLTTRGAEIHDDFEDKVLTAGLRGDWRLEQPTFEAAHEAEHGAQILYDLANDKTEAARVAALSPYQQLKYVQGKDAEIAAKMTPRTTPRAGTPPTTATRGVNSKTGIKPDTDNLDDFEKAWAADTKKKR